MQHFHGVLLLAEVVVKLHTAIGISLLSNFEQSTARQLGYDLVRTGGGGSWTSALRLSIERVRKYVAAIDKAQLADWLGELHLWLLRKQKRTDAADLSGHISRLRIFRSQLAGEVSGPAPISKGTPLDLMELLVEVRNKTTAHAAYGADFYEAHVDAIDAPVQWLVANTPLWQADLAVTLQRRSGVLARCLRGAEPTRVVELASTARLGRSVCLLPGGDVQEVVSLISVDAADNNVYIANGNWRDSDSSAEFLCHSLEAQRPDQGKRRIELPDYAVRPTAAPPSETEELGAFRHESGVALNNLPLPTATYVRRPSLEDRLRPMMYDAQRRHIVTVRGHGGIGKTSLIMALCRELVELGPECPYDAVIWLSARDIDLTVRGPKQVRRSTGTLKHLESSCKSL